MPGIAPLRDFVQSMTRLVEHGLPPAALLAEGKGLMAQLVAQDGWLPDAFAVAGPTYQQYLLHCDPLERFSLVSFVWGPGQRTPIHDHLTWGIIGQLRGAEVSTEIIPGAPGTAPREGRRDDMRAGEVASVSPDDGPDGGYDIHVVENALPGATSISIHCYGGNIGTIRRHAWDAATSARRDFVSGYANAVVPNLWT